MELTSFGAEKIPVYVQADSRPTYCHRPTVGENCDKNHIFNVPYSVPLAQLSHWPEFAEYLVLELGTRKQ
jgi:hypothetical protein